MFPGGVGGFVDDRHEVWDNEDFLIYFEGHWETWEFNKETQSVRCLRSRNQIETMDGRGTKMIDLAGARHGAYTWGADTFYILSIFYSFCIYSTGRFLSLCICIFAFSSSSTYTHIIYISKAI